MEFLVFHGEKKKWSEILIQYGNRKLMITNNKGFKNNHRGRTNWSIIYQRSYKFYGVLINGVTNIKGFTVFTQR